MSRTLLFLCPHGAAKSVIASTLCERDARARGIDVNVACAGTDPDDGISAPVIELLKEEGIDVSAQRPRLVTAADLAGAWRIFSMGCDVGDIAPPGKQVENWGDVPSPSEDLEGVRTRVKAHLEVLLDELA